MHPAARAGRARLAFLLVFVLAFAYRFLSAKFTNDDYLFPARGQQILRFGEWPVRDLLEEGRPLHYVASALAQAVGGHRLIGELLLNVSALAMAAGLVAWITARVTRSPAAGVCAGVVAALTAPRLYDYPKSALAAIGLWLCWKYLEQPSRRRQAVLAAFTVFAFLFRHDYGIYVGVSALATIMLSQIGEPSGRMVRTASVYAVMVLAGLLPYLIYVQVHGGVRPYVVSILRFTEREVSRSQETVPQLAIDTSAPLLPMAPAPLPAVHIRWAGSVHDVERARLEARYGLTKGSQEEGRTWRYELINTGSANIRALVEDSRIDDTSRINRQAMSVPQESAGDAFRRVVTSLSAGVAPGFVTRGNGAFWLYQLARLLPIVVLVYAIVKFRMSDGSIELKQAAVVAVFCLAASPILLRGDLGRSDRLGDVIVPVSILAGWTIAALTRAGRQPAVRALARTAAVVIALVTVASAAAFGRTGSRLEDTAILKGRADFARQASRLMAQSMSAPPDEDLVPGVRGLVRYLRRCIGPDDRVFVNGFHPEIPFYAGRGFAGDRPFIIPGFWALPDEQSRTVQKMTAQRIPLALVDTAPDDGLPGDQAFARAFPILQNFFDSRYDRRGVINFGDSAAPFVVWTRRLAPSVIDSATGLPCFR